MSVEEQKQVARGIADLLARLHPEVEPLLRLQLAHWLAGRVVRNRTRCQGNHLTADAQASIASSAERDYQI